MSTKDSVVILVVDDEPTICNLIQQVLEKEAYRVITANDGFHALALAGAFQDRIHLLITETDLARMSGIELARQLLTARPDIRVVLMSGRPAGNDPKLPFLGKPFDIDTLRAKVRETLGPQGKHRGRTENPDC